MLIKREIEGRLRSLAQQFTAIAILGPRQSGKTTLAKMVFGDYKYFSFEELGTRQLVLSDPRAFLEKYKDEAGLILDEIQHVPELLSYMQTHIDTYKKRGHFIITGSQNILVNESITQSLAGRIAILTLLPLSISELQNAKLLPENIEAAILKGGYPSIYADGISAYDWYSFYINTYIERDVRQLKNITDLSLFQKFMQICAGRIGQELNMSSIANDLGLSVTGVKQWLSILEATYVIFLLQPYYKNFNKRLTKSPKLYFYDTGVATALLGITDEQQLFSHFARGALFESFIISDLKKQCYNLGVRPNLYFWRDQSGYEVDCILEAGAKNIPIEIKASSTYNTNFLTNLAKWNAIADESYKNNILIYGGNDGFDGPCTIGGKIIGWKSAGDIVPNLITK